LVEIIAAFLFVRGLYFFAVQNSTILYLNSQKNQILSQLFQIEAKNNYRYDNNIKINHKKNKGG